VIRDASPAAATRPQCAAVRSASPTSAGIGRGGRRGRRQRARRWRRRVDGERAVGLGLRPIRSRTLTATATESDERASRRLRDGVQALRHPTHGNEHGARGKPRLAPTDRFRSALPPGPGGPAGHRKCATDASRLQSERVRWARLPGAHEVAAAGRIGTPGGHASAGGTSTPRSPPAYECRGDRPPAGRVRVRPPPRGDQPEHGRVGGAVDRRLGDAQPQLPPIPGELLLRPRWTPRRRASALVPPASGRMIARSRSPSTR